MSTDVIISLVVAIAAVLTMLGGVSTVIFQIGGFRTMVTERFRALENLFDITEKQHLREVSDLKQTVARIDAIVTALREDRVRLNSIEERVHELQQRLDALGYGAPTVHST